MGSPLAILRSTLAVVALPSSAAAVEVEVLSSASADSPDPVVHDDADLVLLAVSEHRGSAEPCGCGTRPLGGLARLTAYARAVRAEQPALVLHAGGWLDASADGPEITEAAREANRRYSQALRRSSVDVLHVAWPDLAALAEPRPGLVSANLHSADDVLRRTVVTVGEHRVLVTGVSRGGPAYLHRPGTDVRAPVPAVREVLDLTPDHDLAVVLAYDDPQAARAVSMVDGVDLVIEAGGYQARWKPLQEAAVHVRTWDQGLRVTELRLWLEGTELERVVVREVDLDEALDGGERRRSR